jgi:hypothetical protein
VAVRVQLHVQITRDGAKLVGGHEVEAAALQDGRQVDSQLEGDEPQQGVALLLGELLLAEVDQLPEGVVLPAGVRQGSLSGQLEAEP